MENLQELYLKVYEEKDDSYLETNMKKRAENNKKALDDMNKTDAHKDMVTTVRKTFEEVDLFDYLLEYLVAEGYADTNASAIAIMANMSEEWKQSIVEETKRTEYLQKKFDAENKAKSGSAHTYIPGKQNTGSALYKARQSERQMKGDK
jgi:hypothetical protein